MTTTTSQVCLPGQCGAQEGPVDLTVMYAVHHAFRRDLAAFSRAVPVTPVEERTTWTALEHRLPLATTLFLVPWVCDEVPETVRRRAFADAGRAYRLAHALTRRRFERQTQQAFAYARAR